MDTANFIDDIRLNAVCKGEHFRNEIESKIQNNKIGKPPAMEGKCSSR
jgi:hypothetical protein